MTKFNLSNATTESQIFNHNGGRITVYMSGIFDGGSIKFLSRANGVGFIQLTDDDFNVRFDDVLNVSISANSEYKIIMVGAGASTFVNVAIL
tara:strand:+ start:528 stop:803 length:276 start_codon:yes stop_codon:yes gene_type:complete